MEPFARTSVIITCDHLSETDLVAIAVSGLALLVFVVTFMEGLFVGGDSRYWNCGFLRVSFRCWIITSRWACARLRFSKCGEDGCGCLGVSTLAWFRLVVVCGSSIHIFAFVSCWYGGSVAFLVLSFFWNGDFVLEGAVAGCRSGV
jgi:hypothetical protein